MLLVVDDSLSVGWVTGALRPPQLSGSFFVKATYALTQDGPPKILDEAESVCGEVRAGEGPVKEVRYASDFVPFKPKADVLLVGTAHCPGGSERREMRVRMRVGDLSKELAVRGRRSFKRQMLSLSGSVVSAPDPFTSVPLTWAHAFGGPKSRRNPVGMGHGTSELPMIVYADAPTLDLSTKQTPACYGPTAPEWEPRSGMVGTYKKGWVDKRWPWRPDDFDYGYYNAAPEDQQVSGYLRGDEEMLLDNLHPKHRRYRARLPGQRARVFLAEGDTYREVPLVLDTLWIDMDAEKMALVWRGVTEVASLKLREIDRVFAMVEPLSEPDHAPEHYAALERDYSNAIEVEDDEPDEEADAAEAAADAAVLKLDQETAALEKEAEGLLAEQERGVHERIREAGLDPAVLLAPPTAEQIRIADVELLAAVAAMRELHGAKVPAFDVPTYSGLQAELASAEEELAEEEPMTREEVEAAVAEGESLAESNLADLDLSGALLEGADLQGAELTGANLAGANLASANLAGADMSKVDLTDADLTHARLDEVDLAGAVLAGAKLRYVSLVDADLTGLDLPGADFSGAHGTGCDFSGSNLDNARFAKAELERGDFAGCRLAGADFTGAKLPSASFEEAVAPGIILERAHAPGLQASDGADFTGGDFRRVVAPGSIWGTSTLDGADFTGAELDRADFAEGFLRKAVFTRASLVDADFDDADLTGAQLREANLLRGSFDRALLVEADLKGANAYAAGFWETETKNAKLDETNLKGTSRA
ncbi:MAG: DUF2169 family type VI secretion system accessory protein [Planctomycetota bacterium]